MGKTRIQTFQNRRIWKEDGIYLFCRSCGDYKLESEFYNSKDTPFGKTYKCKLHYDKTYYDDDTDTEYLKMSPITDFDFEETERVLKDLGYKFGPGELPVWKQFEIKHNL